MAGTVLQPITDIKSEENVEVNVSDSDINQKGLMDATLQVIIAAPRSTAWLPALLHAAEITQVSVTY